MDKQSLDSLYPRNESGYLSSLSLRANISWTFLGNVIYEASKWGVFVILAKLGSPEKVGQFVFALAITAPVFIFFDLKLRIVQATDANYEYAFRDYLGLRIITNIFALLIVISIVVVADYSKEQTSIILALGTAKAFESISDVFYGLLQQRERMDRIAKSMMIRGPLSLLVLGSIVYLTNNIFLGAAGMAASWGLVLIIYDVRNGLLILKSSSKTIRSSDQERPEKDSIQPRWNISTLLRLAWLTFPLGVVAMLVSLKSNIPRYFISAYMGKHALGIFGAMAYMMVAGDTIVSAIGQSASPRLAKYYASGDGKAFRSLLFKLVKMGVIVACIGVAVAYFLGKEMLTLLYSSEYAIPDLFLFLVIAMGISYVASFLGYGMTAARYFRVQVPLFAMVVVSLALACLLLIPSKGLYGAAMALIIASILHLGSNSLIIVRALSAIKRNN